MKEQIFKLGEHLFTPCVSIGTDWNDPDDSKRSKARTKQYTTLFLRTYEPLDSFVDALRSLATLDAFSYIVHNEDLSDDGTPKAEHIHALLHFPPDGRIRLTTLAKLFRHNTRVEIPLDVASCLDYMLHANQPEKHQYDPDERIDHNLDILLGTRKSSEARQQEEKEARNLAFLNDLDSLTPYEMARRYGKDYIKNVDRYNAFRDTYIPRDEDTSLSTDIDADSKLAGEYRCLVERTDQALFRHQPTPESIPENGFYVVQELARKLRELERLPDLVTLINAYVDCLKMVAPSADLALDSFSMISPRCEYSYNPYKEN